MRNDRRPSIRPDRRPIEKAAKSRLPLQLLLMMGDTHGSIHRSVSIESRVITRTQINADKNVAPGPSKRAGR